MRLVSHRHRFVLHTIPKNACVTLRWLFHLIEDGDLRALERMEARPRLDIHALCRRRYGGREPGPGYRAFAILRNPWSRVRAAHADKVAHKGWLRPVGVRSLSDFVRYLEAAGVDRASCDQHWRGQHTFVEAGAEILRVERLQEDVDAMLWSVGLPPVRLPNWKAGRTASHKERYSTREAAAVGRIYARDAALGGYACPPDAVDPEKPDPPATAAFRARCRLHSRARAGVYAARRLLRLPVW